MVQKPIFTRSSITFLAGFWLTVYLAKQGQDVLLLDTDAQRSAASWASTRSTDEKLPTVHCVEKYGDVLKASQDLSERYKYVIIDAGGRDSKELRSAMLAANIMCIPLKASQFDLWTVERMNTLVSQTKVFNRNLKAFATISMGPTNPQINETQDAQEMLSDFDELILTSTVIRERKVYRDAISEGTGVIERENQKAKVEIKNLIREIYNDTI